MKVIDSQKKETQMSLASEDDLDLTGMSTQSHQDDIRHEETADKSPLTFGLLHTASEKHDHLKIALTFAELCLRHYEKVYLVISPLHEEEALPQLKEWGFSDPSFLNRDTLWDKSHRLGVAKIADHEFVKVVGSQRDSVGDDDSGQNFKGSLLLFESSSFGIRFLDCLGELLQGLFLISEKNIVDLIESYQTLKSFYQINPLIMPEFFLITDEINAGYQMIQKKIGKIVRKHLNMNLDCQPLWDRQWLQNQNPVSLRGEDTSAIEMIRPPRDEHLDAVRSFVCEKILVKG